VFYYDSTASIMRCQRSFSLSGEGPRYQLRVSHDAGRPCGLINNGRNRMTYWRGIGAGPERHRAVRTIVPGRGYVGCDMAKPLSRSAWVQGITKGSSPAQKGKASLVLPWTLDMLCICAGSTIYNLGIHVDTYPVRQIDLHASLNRSHPGIFDHVSPLCG
jgi:hypothetical protein